MFEVSCIILRMFDANTSKKPLFVAGSAEQALGSADSH